MAPYGAELLHELPAAAHKLGRDFGMLHTRPKWHRLTFMWHVYLACVKHRIEYIHVNQAGLCRLVNVVAQHLKIPTVVHVRLVEDIPRVAGLSASAKAPVTLIFVSEDMQERYTRIASPSPNRFSLAAYDPFEMSDDIDLRARDSKEIVCIGRLTPIKGQVKLIDAVAICRNAGLKVCLKLIGSDPENGDYERALRQQTLRLELSEFVEFVGYVSDVQPYLRNAAFICIPSEYEPLGRIVFEAWDRGVVPICSSKSGGVSEAISASKGGILYGENSAENIAATIISAQSLSGSEHQQLVANGRAWAAANASLSDYARKFDTIIECQTSDHLQRLATHWKRGDL